MHSKKDYKTNKTCLYRLPDKKLYYNDFQNAIKNVGINQGDTLLVHSDILAFGVPNISNRDIFMSVLIDLFFDALGPTGNLIMPTFSFSFPNVCYTFSPEV